VTDPFEAFVPTRERIAAPFTRQATVALAKGWFPIPVKGKNHVPTGVTGHAGVVNEEKVRKQLITRELGYDNLAVRHDGTIAIDVDVRDGKNGAATMARFAQERGLSPLPATYSSTARGDNHPSRQYFYRLPEYVKLVSKPRIDGHDAEDVEICQYHHRYSVVYPSVHPDISDADPTYYWYKPGVEGFSWGERTLDMPSVNDIPFLPEEWIAALSKGEDADLDFDAEIVDPGSLISSFRDGEPSPPVRNALELARTQHPGHDETYKSLYKALMYGREGHPGVKELVQVVLARHQNYLETEHPERARKNELASIFKDASTKAQQTPVTNEYRPYSPSIVPLPGGGQISVSPGVTGGFASLGKVKPIESTGLSTLSHDTGDETAGQTTSTQDGAFVLPGHVWEHSVELATIKKAALSRMVSPDAVLHSCLATIASMLHHQSYLETGRGPTVLSYYCAVVGPSGTGKTEAFRCADDLLESWQQGQLVQLGHDKYRRVEISTGEGMVEVYMGDEMIEEVQKDDKGEDLIDDDTGEPIVKRKKVRQQVRHNALFTSDEGRQMLAIASRPGSTIMSTLCSMWSGTSTGAANAKSENSRTIAKRSYILGLVMGFQPATMDALFEDAAGGAPQRFSFASAVHPDVSADPIDFPPQLAPKTPAWAPVQMALSDKHQRLVRQHQADKNNGTIEESDLDGHKMLSHCRIAALLALLHSQTSISDETWDLAEVILNTSRAFRDDLSQRAKREAEEQARRKAEATVKTNVASAVMVEQNTKLNQVADTIVDRLGDHANGEAAKRDIRGVLSASMRKYFNEAIELAVQQGRIVAEDVVNPETNRKTAMLRLNESED
jgi:hypothetical protein